MIVLDASALVDLLLRRPAATAIEERVFAAGDEVHAPHLIDLEVAQVLRRFVAAGYLAPSRADECFVDLADLGLRRHPHHLLLSRVWELRANLTAYDGIYVALAEALAAPLLTCDRRLGSASGHRAVIEVV